MANDVDSALVFSGKFSAGALEVLKQAFKETKMVRVTVNRVNDGYLSDAKIME